MYQTLLLFHSLFRWLVFISLVYAIIRALRAYRNQLAFTSIDDNVRHLTATIIHIQFVIGIILYFQSPIVKSFLNNVNRFSTYSEPLFFSMIHISMMFIAVGLVSTGSSKAKRKETDREKFATIMVWFIIALLLIMIAIPWPFSPLAARPYIRTF